VADEKLAWIKASRSMATGACVELAVDNESVALRNSRHPETVLRFTKAEFGAFVHGAAQGEFNLFLE
jgi:hypothetical protein